VVRRAPGIRASERGATAVEYALILAMVAGTIVAALVFLGQGVAALFGTPLPGL
jgi:Flp pilus assembly pilin Flp